MKSLTISIQRLYIKKNKVRFDVIHNQKSYRFRLRLVDSKIEVTLPDDYEHDFENKKLERQIIEGLIDNFRELIAVNNKLEVENENHRNNK